MHVSTKRYGHDIGLSCCFRQWRAKSHCRLLHGYALAVTFEFKALDLDENNWVMDFGGLKEVKEILQQTFDHKLVVAQDDPMLPKFRALESMGAAKIVVLKSTGCEAFAEYIFHYISGWLQANSHWQRVNLRKVTVAEHGANSASFEAE